MKLIPLLTASLMTLSLVGCCCGRNIVTDSCDPCCGRPRGCGVLRVVTLNYLGFGSCWNCGASWHGRGCGSCGSCGSSCGGCGEMPMDCGCGSGSCGVPMSGGGGCGCGGTYTPQSTYSVPMNAPQSFPTPQSSPSPSPAPTVPPQVPPADASTMLSPKSSPSIQTVTYEEFQRLPGTVISGPGVTTGAPTTGMPTTGMPTNSVASIQRSVGATQRFLPRPANSVPSASVAIQQNQQAVWVPAN